MASRQLLNAMVILACLTAVSGFCLAVLRAPSIIENDYRLAPTFAVFKGYKLYYGPQEGPVLSTIYGPITTLAYAPVLFSSTPMMAVRLATILSLAFLFAPMVLFFSEGRRHLGLPIYAGALALAAALIFLSNPLSYSSVLVHADAPALAAACLACWFTGWKAVDAPKCSALLAGMAAALSMMAKQNMVPLVPALLIWWLIRSRKDALLFIAGLILSLAGIWGAVLTVSSSPAAAWFNWFQIPTHQPYSKSLLIPTVDYLARQLLLYLLPVIGLLVMRVSSLDIGNWKERLLQPSILLLWTACWLIPTSVLGRIKTGGSENALSPAIYFIALVCGMELSVYLSKLWDRDYLQDDKEESVVQYCCFFLQAL